MNIEDNIVVEDDNLTGPRKGSFNLTADQENAKQEFLMFLCDPDQTMFVLSGYSGCGKSTLVENIISEMPKFFQAAHLINPDMRNYDVKLTATTNKAAENLAEITGMEVTTIHSFLQLRVETDYKKGTSTLIPRNANIQYGYLLFIDEASYVDRDLLAMIAARTKDCKIVFIGDEAQLTQFGTVGAPVFEASLPGAALTEVVRQAAGNPIIDLATAFRHTVNTGVWPSFKPDGEHIIYLTRAQFNVKMLEEFGRPNWHYADSKALAWTNKCVIGMNNFIRSHLGGTPEFKVGDYAVCNSFITIGKSSVKTDQLVHITEISEDCECFGVEGNYFGLDGYVRAFMPKTMEARNLRIKQAKAQGDTHIVASIDQSWVDLRAAQACTINKAQGSTYGTVFVDLDDISRCNSGDQIARMLYVGVSRARHRVYLTGDLV